MQNNQKSITELGRKLKSANFKVGEFAKTIELLNKKMVDDSISIDNLKTELEKKKIIISELETKVDTLITSNNTKNKRIDEQTEKLNTAYYVIGTEKELKAHKILTKEGGFIGIGKNRKLQSNFDKSYYTKINISKVSKIKLSCKKAKIMSTHPSSSYKFEQSGKKIDYLIITDSEEFWSFNRALVIVIEK